MIIVFPIGGTGGRFLQGGYSTPKPLIQVNGKPMIKLVLEHYPKGKGIEYTFAVSDSIFGKMLQVLPHECSIVRLTEKTNGPVETLLQHYVKGEIDTEDELLIADCDSFMNLYSLENALDCFRKTNAYGGATIRICVDPACSYAEVNGDGSIIRTAEKQVISNISTTGPYWWKHGKDFVWAAKKEAKQGRYNISPCFNQIIDEKKLVMTFLVDSFVHLGTPEELDAYNSRTALQPH